MSTARAPEQAVVERATSVHHFEIETEGADLLDWKMIDALYEAGCSDATIRHGSVEFDREARRWPQPSSRPSTTSRRFPA